ncbi:MAG: chemotaxis protein CheW [Rhodocyclaceae bacterium]|nr:chemotaxis protein CheW [Rhodocyclaceae bacterium]MCE2725067.1 chemotaxis protein CheW [Betaproteobacteria bacterium]MCA3020394.1 chemotaxis protein CheW [Rhodocyclaceae bacterium]MCA3021768.1 chemotaxis protein CheW [Rhodocyclaceae bacterium]MCA3026727.1 chemotaxis protein CheW [Rhodocyclaceae bacterium]
MAMPAGEYLTFRLGTEEYGIDILKVQEIRGYEQPTRIAGAPAFLKGVVNLRGVIVPIVDLRIKFGLGSAEYNSFTVVIILNIAKKIVGVVVDQVSDVVALDSKDIRPAPTFSEAVVESTFIQGIGQVDDRMLILTDIERLLTASEMGLAFEVPA